MASQTSNESVAELLDCLRAAESASNNTSAQVTNATCSNASTALRHAAATHKEMRILLYSLIFLLSVLGNLLIIAVLLVNKRMRTVTNSFLLSLALSDLMMALFCMPFTLIPNILGDFTFGAAMCKTVTYFMGISVSISTFSLVAIAIERYSAICNPLKSRAWQTPSHAYRVIAATWALSLVVMAPYPVFSALKAFPKADRSVGHMCRLAWPSRPLEQTWYVLLLSVLFFVPGLVMMVAYGLISRELYRGIQFELGQGREPLVLKNGINNNNTAANANGNSDDGDGCYIQVSKRAAAAAVELSALTGSGGGGGVAAAGATPKPRAERPRSNASQARLVAKKRVIRMLTVIVALFFVCWLPLYSVNAWRAFDPHGAQRALSGAPISFIHLLSHTSACVNPLIYCFMNTRFRKALLATFARCCPRRPLCCRGRGRGGGDDVTQTTGASVSRCSYTTVSRAGL